MDAARFPATLDALDQIRRYVMNAAEQAGLEKKAAYRLSLAVDEIATNIVTHGYEEGGLTGDIVVKADIDAEALTVALEDTAVPFNPLAAPSPDDLDAPLEERKVGGLGVFLTMQGVDKFDYEWVDGKNRNIFVMYRPKEE